MEDILSKTEKTGPNTAPMIKMGYGLLIPNTTRRKIFTTSRVRSVQLASLKKATTTSIYTKITTGKLFTTQKKYTIILMTTAVNYIVIKEDTLLKMATIGESIAQMINVEYGLLIPNTTRRKIFITSRIRPVQLASLKKVVTTSIYTIITVGKSYIPPHLFMTLLLNMTLISSTITTKYQTTIKCKK